MTNPFSEISDFSKAAENLKTNNCAVFPIFPSHEPAVSDPLSVHVFISGQSYYDTACQRPPAKGHIRFVLPYSFFSPVEDSYEPLIYSVLKLVSLGKPITCDVVCCYDANCDELPGGVCEFLKFVLHKSGTVRFSDFALRPAKAFLRSIDLPLDYKLSSHSDRNITMRFNPRDMIDSQQTDLKILGEVATEGEAIVSTMANTQLMDLDETPSYAKKLASNASHPLLILMDAPNGGRIILSTCHFVELGYVRGINAKRMEEIIRAHHGDAAAEDFSRNAELALKRGGTEGLAKMASAGLGTVMASMPSSN